MKLKYNSSQVDRSKEELTPPTPGVYRAKIESATFQKEHDRIEFVVRQTEPDSAGNGKGYGFWDRVRMDLDWKIDQYLRAVGFDTENNPEGEFDVPKDFVGKDIMIRVKSDYWTPEGATEAQYRPKLATPLPLIEGDDEEGWEDESELETDEESEPETISEDEDIDSDEIEGLGAAADDEDEEAIARLDTIGRAAGLDPDEYATWGELSAAIIETMVPAEKPKPVKAAAKKAAAKPAPEREPEPDDDAGENYDEWDLNDIKAEAASRGLSDKGPKSAIVARLRKHDSDPFAD